jgi:hypothetical protein
VSVTEPSSNSFMLLTMVKAGSSYAGEIFQEVFRRHGYDLFDPTAIAFAQGFDVDEFIGQQAARFCEPRCFFGPFRNREAGLAAQISPARQILHIRDPRDCITSLYYSLRYSHPVPSGADEAQFLGMRRSLEAMTLDSFVRNVLYNDLFDMHGYSRNLATFCQLKEVRHDTILSKYEDMVMNFPDWLLGIVGQFGIDIDGGVIGEIVDRTNFLVNLRVQENPYNHKRQILPGDYKRKLAAKTQRLVTDFFAAELEYFGYL